ncbi:MAG: alanine dehydrogenase [Chitinivibrionales bacterium]|nr:alanine dehydrogenase [Chitinivibrionales bacterium]MBD3358544.1 alanine dehydrogenase [Chitinivibrionales bacterium]
MVIGIPGEIKLDEYRVGMLPFGVRALVEDGHRVLIERNAGVGAGFNDAEYQEAGARMVETPHEIYERADLVVKVKEPQAGEVATTREDQILFCYFHFASSRELTEGCLESGLTALGFETLTNDHGGLPLLTPMSEIAGKMSIQEGARCLESHMKGRGVLLGGVAGVEPAQVLVVGGGVVGSNAAHVAAGMGACVVIMDINVERLRHLDEIMPPNVSTAYCEPHAVVEHAARADLVIGAVLVPGGKAPVLLRQEHIGMLKRGTVLVDVAVDQGGCFETSHPTTHRDPVFVVDGVVHYCVANMPGAVSRTSSHALGNVTFPYVRDLAGSGLEAFLNKSAGNRAALNISKGKIAHPAVAEAFPDLA